jgi:hypothetical protein
MTFRKQIFLSFSIALGVAILLNGIGIYAEWFAVSPNGSDGILWATMLLSFLLLLALVVIPIYVVLLIFKKTRKIALLALIAGITYVIVAISIIGIGSDVRMNEFHKLARRSVPLVEAISKFSKEKGHPPSSLQELVPEYLASVPDTGMGAYPKYEYEVGGEAREWDNNPWVLYVNTSSGGLNWDMFMYFPRQNYPKTGYGGWLERIGDWAYVHE